MKTLKRYNKANINIYIISLICIFLIAVNLSSCVGMSQEERDKELIEKEDFILPKVWFKDYKSSEEVLKGMTKKEREEYVELLKPLDLGLETRLRAKVGLLSGGQRQALTLLMATLKKPKLLLLDEHTAALDPKTAAKVLELSDKIIAEHNLTALMVTHNMKDAIVHGNRLIMMWDGKIILDIKGEEKKNLTVDDLLHQFTVASGKEFANDRALLG